MKGVDAKKTIYANQTFPLFFGFSNNSPSSLNDGETRYGKKHATSLICLTYKFLICSKSLLISTFKT